MDAKTIKEQMTKGEWKPSFTEYPKNPKKIYDGVCVILDNHFSGGQFIEKIVDTVLPDSDEVYAKIHQNIEADVHAITTAVNNTYGKGLNPEVYEDVVNGLDWALSMLNELNDYTNHHGFTLSKEALKKARINP